MKGSGNSAFLQKRTFFAVTSDVLKSTKKEPLKVNDISIEILIDRCQPLAPPTNDTQTFSADSRSRFLIKPSKITPRLP